MILAVINALVAIVQITVDSTFLKYGPPRLAFGNVVRASGIFQAEYELGYCQILAIIITLQRYRGMVRRYFLIPLLTISVLLTFHRLDFIILNLCLIIYTGLFSSSTRKVMVSLVIGLVALSTTTIYWVVAPMIKTSSFVQQRLQEDTVSGRLAQYQLILTTLAEFTDVTFFGLGDYDNKAYDILMKKRNLVHTIHEGDKTYSKGSVVHNGFLAVGILHGALAMTFFTAFLFSMLFYFKKKISRATPNTIVSFFAVLIWILCNLSNGMNSFDAYFPLMVALLSGAGVGQLRGRTLWLC